MPALSPASKAEKSAVHAGSSNIAAGGAGSSWAGDAAGDMASMSRIMSSNLKAEPPSCWCARPLKPARPPCGWASGRALPVVRVDVCDSYGID
eukprot:scaffold125916_cov26-Tisochrysis_lutea.AAC.3